MQPALKAKHELVGYDIQAPKNKLKYDHHIGDIRNYENLYQCITDDIDLIIHLAAEHKDYGLSEEDYNSVNVQGIENLLKVAEKKNIHKIIIFSSSAIYGEGKNLDEKTIPAPKSHYGKSKLLAEKMVEKWVSENNSKVIILRPAAVYGPGNKANIFKFINLIYKNKFIMVGRGKNIKSFVFIDNLIDATIFSIHNFSDRILKFNVVDNPPMSISEFTDCVRKISDTSSWHSKLFIPLIIANPLVFTIGFFIKIFKKNPIVTNERIKKFVSNTYIDGSLIRSRGFWQKTSTEDGLLKTISWINSIEN